MKFRNFLFAPILFFIASCSSTTIPPGVEPDVHKACLKATDYSGCIDRFSKNKEPEKLLSLKEEALLDELKKLPARMTRTSLVKFQENVSDFVDALSLAKFENPNSTLVQKASKLLVAFDLLYEEWKYTIDNSATSPRGYAASSSIKRRYDTLFGGNTFDIRCVKASYINGKFQYSDAIFNQMFLVVYSAATQLAKEQTFQFPDHSETALVLHGNTGRMDIGGWNHRECDRKYYAGFSYQLINGKIKIVNVFKGSDAGNYLKVDDEILEVNNIKLDSVDLQNIYKAISLVEDETPMKIKVKRNNEELEFLIKKQQGY